VTLPRIALLLIFPVFAAGSPFFSPNTQTTCPTPSTVGAYQGVTCFTGNEDSWLEFNGFINSPSANGLEVQALANATNQGFYYNEGSPSGPLPGPLNFQIGFNATGFNETLDSVTFHVTTTSPPQGMADVTMYVCTGPASTCMTSPLDTLTLGTGTLPFQTVTFTPMTSIGLLFVGNIDALSTLTQFEVTIGNSGGGGTGPLGGVPEPATPLLVGTGLLAVGFFRKRMRS
jgi:hypothetical protein